MANDIDPLTGLTGGGGNKQEVPKVTEGYDPSVDILSGMLSQKPGRYAGEYLPDGEVSKFDEGITWSDLDNIERQRAMNQPWTGKAFNGLVGGIGSGLLTAIEDIGYTVDIQNNLARIAGLEEVETNFVSKFAKEAKEGLNKAMPIHRMSQDTIDMSDPGFYWSSLRGVLDSAVGFAIPGMAATKLVGGIQKAARMGTGLANMTAKMGQTGKRMDAYMKMVGNSPRAQRMMNTVGSAYITNYGESKMMALEQFENSVAAMTERLELENYNHLKEQYPNKAPEYLEREAERITQEELAANNHKKLKDYEEIAGDEANNFMWKNKAFMFSDMIGLHGIYKSKGFTRELLKRKDLSTWAKRFVKPTSENVLLQGTKEAAEEIGQNILQMEGEYQSVVKAGLEHEDPSDFASRVYQYGLSDQALLEGAMGFFGGGPQRIFTEALSGNLKKGTTAQHNKRVEEQQKMIEDTIDFLSSSLGNFAEGQKLRAEAISKGEDNLEDYMKKLEFLNIATRNFALGTTEKLERELQRIAEGVTDEEKSEKKWGDNYQQEAKDQLELLADMEKNFLRHSQYGESAEISRLYENRRLLSDDKRRIESELSSVNARLEADENPGDKQLKDFLERSLEKVNEAISDNDKMYNHMIGSEFQKEYRKSQREQRRQLRGEARNNRAKTKKNNTKKDSKNKNKNTDAKTTAADQAADATSPEPESGVTPEEAAKKEPSATEVTDVGERTETEPSPDEFADEQTDGPTVTGFAGKKVTPAETDDGPSVDQLTPDEVDRAKMSDGQLKLNDEFNADAKNFLDSLHGRKPRPDATDSALAPDELTDEEFAEQVVTLRRMIRQVRGFTNNPNAGFDEFMTQLMKHDSAENFDGVFRTIELMYAMAEPSHVVSNMSFGEYISISSDQREARKQAQESERINYNGQYTTETDDEVNQEQYELGEQMHENQHEEGETVEPDNTRKATSGSGILAYLSRVYEKVKFGHVFTRRDSSNQLNNGMLEKEILDADKYPEGTDIELVVEDDGDVDVYPEDKSRNDTIKWKDKKLSWSERTKEERAMRFRDQVPIAVYAKGKKIGYLHETNWIDPVTVSGDVDADRERSRKIRDHIIARGKRGYKTKISRRTDGVLFESVEGMHTLKDAMGQDPNTTIVIGRNMGYSETKDKVYEGGNIVNAKDPKEGVAYILVPVGPKAKKKRIAIPLKNKKLSENQKVVDTISNALKVFYYWRENPQHEVTADAVMKQTGINIRTAEGVKKFIRLYINNFNYGSGYDNLEEYLSRDIATDDEIPAERTVDAFAHMHPWVNKNGEDDMNFTIGSGRRVTYTYMSRQSLSKLSVEKRQELFDNVATDLAKMYGHASIDGINSKQNVAYISNDGEVTGESYNEYIRSMTEVPFLSHNIGTESEPNYVYTVQPIIEMDFSDILDVTSDSDPAANIKRWMAELKDPDITPERKAELEALIADDYDPNTITEEERTAKVAAEKKRLEEEGDPEGRIIKPITTTDKPDGRRKARKEIKGHLEFFRQATDEDVKRNVAATIVQIATDNPNSITTAELEELGDTDVDPSAAPKNEEFISVGRKGLNFGLREELDDDTVSEALLPTSTEMTKDHEAKMQELSEVMIDPDTNELSGVIISDLASGVQDSMVRYMRSRVTEALFVGEDNEEAGVSQDRVEVDPYYEALKKELVDDNITAVKKDLKNAKRLKRDDIVEQLNRELAHYESIEKAWDRLKALTIENLRNMGSIKTLAEDESKSQEEENQENENANWSDITALTRNPADGLSAKIKQLLSGIREKKKDEEGNYIEVIDPNIGAPMIMEFQTVYETLQRITTGIEPNYKKLIAEVKNHYEAFPFLEDVVNRMEGSSTQLRNQFVVGVTNHYSNMRFIMLEETGSGYKLTEYESDVNAHARVVQNGWWRNLIQSNEVAYTLAEETENEEEQKLVLTMEAKNEANSIWAQWKAGKGFTKTNVDRYLQIFGIDLHDKTLDNIMKGKFIHRGRKQRLAQMVKVQGGLLRTLHDKVLTPGATALLESRVLDDTVVTNLARQDAENQLFSFSTSHRTGGRKVYSYNQNKYIVQRVRELKQSLNENELIENLSKLKFNKTSFWLDMLKEKSTDENPNVLKENLSYWVASLEPLKKKGEAGRENREMHKLGEADLELARIGMLQSFKADQSGGTNRIMQILYPTTSDKTTVMGLRIVAHDLKLDDNGFITDESLDALVKYVIMPEAQRISEYQTQEKRNTEEETFTPDSKEYANGANQFIFFPELNGVPEMWLDNGDLNPAVIEDPDMRPFLREQARRYMDSLVTEKLSDWNEFGLGGSNKKFLDVDYMAGKGSNNPLADVTDKGINRTRAAATDMVFQYLIGNAEVSKMFTGDPALYFKVAGSNRDQDGNRIERWLSDGSVNPQYDFVADAKQTYINMGKRLAADIAPGNELAQSTDNAKNEYVQGFLAENISISTAALNNTILLDGKAAYQALKPIVKKYEDNEITQDQLLAELELYEDKIGKALKSRAYYQIEEADAQEYTSWQEHLYVMQQAGEISDADFKKASKLLAAEKSLPKDLLGKVMQPMKPVYVDNIMDTKAGFERRLYIKSSSFPLLPELTKGTPLDNLRLAMKRDKIDRVAFATAVKVGNVSRPTNILENGEIMSADKISFQNATMRLNRKGFRIQQSVPYDPEKTEINKVTQASKNLFINMLNVKGFKMPKEFFESEEAYQEFVDAGLTGKALQAEYHKIFDRLHAIQKEMLMNEIMDGTTGQVNPMKLRNLLLREAKQRNYPISDKELLVIDKDLTFLYTSPSANKYESLMNSIVTNNIVKMATFGKSYVLGAENGLQTEAPPTELSHDDASALINSQTGIMFTPAWTGKLLGMREENGEIKPAQAIVPWKFKTSDGKMLKMSDFTKTVNGTTILDTEKLPEEVLQLFGMRIPNQGPNSQSWIEIVGFLPEASGDLFIGTKDYVAQMGSDFDVDKIYTYMYSTYVDKHGAMRVHRKPKKGLEGNKKLKDELRILQNKILDIHIGVHKNADPVVQTQIVEPLGFWKLDTIGGDIERLREHREKLTRQTDPVIAFDGGHDARGRGSTQGDGKDKAMRKAANVFIGELSPGNYDSSTFTSGKQIANKAKTKPTIQASAEADITGNNIMLSNTDNIKKGDVVMLARNGETRKTGLTDLTIKTLKEAHEKGATFVVGDMPEVDSQFIEYLQYLGATFTVYHSGIAPRTDVVQPARNTLFTGLSDTYQRRKFKNATAGLAGTGAFSQDSMFNAVAQGKNLIYEIEDSPIYVNFGGNKSNGSLSAERTIDGKFYLSEVISGYQSASVDNENEQILDKIHVNSRTFKVVKILNQLGFGEHVPYFISQDIIVDYIRELEKLSSMTSEFYGNREGEAMRIVLNKPQYRVTEEEKEASTYDTSGDDLTVDNMSGWIERGPLEPNYKVAQNDILDKFVRYDGYGRNLQSVQSAINTDSKGVGKTVMESQMKEEAVIELAASPIKGAFSLIGELEEIESGDNLDAIRESGWFPVKYENQWFKIKPTTINGFATTYGLFTNNELWEKYFPYRDDAVKQLIDRVEMMSTDRSDEFGATAKADRRSQIWRQLKSFVFSDVDLGLYEGTIAEQRDRLLYDKFEKEIRFDETGKRIEVRRPILNQESLATALAKFKETKIGRSNALIQLLDIKYKTNGEPSTIEYRASTADRQDETYIYNAFVNAIKATVRTGKRKGQSPIIGKFKGETYTLRELAQDLVTYSYITGGIQEAVQFVKYIPAAYLATMPFAEVLSRYRSTALNVENMNPAFTKKKTRNSIYGNSPFVEQYFQHFPKEVRSANHNDMVGGKMNRKARTFKLNAAGLKRLGIQNKKKKDPPPYLRMYSKSNKKDSMLFKFNTDKHIYEQIDVLGVLGVSEYDISKKFGESQTSGVKLNKVPQQPVKPDPKEGDSPVETPTTGITPTDGVTDTEIEEGTDIIPDEDPNIPLDNLTSQLDSIGKKATVATEDTISSILAKTQPAETFSEGREKLKAILNDVILNTTNNYNRVLATTLLENVDQLPSKTILKLSNAESDAAGTWRYLEEDGQSDAPHTMNLHIRKVQNLNKNQLERVIMHEILHGLTGYKALAYKYMGSKTEAGRAVYDEITQNPDFKWVVGGPRSELHALKSLTILMNRAKAAILKDPAHKAKYELFVKKIEEKKKKERQGRSDKPSSPKFSKAEIDTYYGLTDVKEFITMAMTEPDFQQLLNDVPAGDDVRTFWVVLKEKLRQLLDAMGFDIVEGSILEKAVNATLDLVVSNDNTSKTMNMGFAGQFDKVLSGEKTQTTRELSFDKRTKKPYYTEGEVIYIADEDGRSVMARITKIEPVNLAEIHDLPEGDAYFVREGRATGKQQFINNTKYLLGKRRVGSIQFELISDNAEIPTAPLATTPKTSPEATANAGERNETYQEEVDGVVTNYNFLMREDGAILGAQKSIGNLADWATIPPQHYYSTYERVKKGKVVQGEIHHPENQVHLEGGKVVTFTEDQLGAVNAIRKWMQTEENLFTLGTFADTGRVGIVKKLAEEYGADNVVVSSLLDSSTQEFEEDTGVQSETFHSLFGLRRNESLRGTDAYRINRAATRKGTLGKYDVVVIDQSQLINNAMYDYILEKAKESNTKVLFVGDPAQVQPVKEYQSKVFEIDNTYTLSKSNEMIHPIAAHAKTLRTNLNTTSGGVKYMNSVNEQGEGVSYMTDEDEFYQDAAMDMADENYTTVMLAASSKNAADLNDHMRKLIHGEQAENDFVIGDKLMGFQTTQAGIDETVTEEGVSYKVKNLTPELENSDGIRGKTLTVEYEVNGAIKTKDIFVISRDQANLDKYVARRQALWSKVGRAKKGEKFDQKKKIAYAQAMDFQRKNILPVSVKIGESTIRPEIGYGYALDVYRSRGMKFDVVYATEDALKMKTNHLRNQYKYSVAVAAKQNLNIHTRKKVQDGNSYVDKPVPAPPPPKRKASAEKGSPTEPGAEASPGIDNLANIADSVPSVNLGKIIRSDSKSEMIVPQDFVSDEELDTFIRKCKGG